MAKPKQSRRQEFEADLTATFGEREEEFAPKLVEMLYSLWREGEKRGARDERSRQADAISAHKGPLVSVEDGTMQKRLQEMVAPHPVAELEKKDTRSTFGKVLAGDEPILKVPESRFPTVKVPDFMVTTTPNREFFGEWLKETVGKSQPRYGGMAVPTTTTTLRSPQLPPLKTTTIQTKKKKLDAKLKK